MSLSSVTAALFAVFALVCPLASHAATLQIDGAGQLLGAEGVDVGGVLYDVDFVDGTCAALFDGCDGAEDFTFTTEVAALAAASALQTQVFVDGPDGNFGSIPSLTNGCEDVVTCGVYTPFAPSEIVVQADVAIFLNLVGPGGFTFANDFLITADTTLSPSVVFAAWDISQATVVPLPATGWLFLSGLIGLFFVKRRANAV